MTDKPQQPGGYTDFLGQANISQMDSNQNGCRTAIREVSEQVESADLPIHRAREPEPVPFDTGHSSAVDYQKDLESLPEILPQAIWQTLSSIHATLGADIGLGFQIAYGQALVEIGKKACIGELDFGPDIPTKYYFPSQFLLTVASSGSGKSYAHDLTVGKFREEIVEEYGQKYKIDCRACKSTNDRIERAIKKLEDGEQKIPDWMSVSFPEIKFCASYADQIRYLAGYKQDFPPNPRNWCDNTTEERLIELMDAQGGAYLLSSPDGAPILQRTLKAAYSNDKGGSPENFYIKAVSGDAVGKERVGQSDNPINISIPALTIQTAVQPIYWEEFIKSQKTRGSGLLARISLWMHDESKGIPDALKRSDRMQKQAPDTDLLRQMLRNLRKWSPKYPVKFLLDDEADNDFVNWRNEMFKLAQFQQLYVDHKDIVRKTCVNALRDALAFHLIDHALESDKLNSVNLSISLSTWLRAKKLRMIYFKMLINEMLDHNSFETHLVQKSKKVLWRKVTSDKGKELLTNGLVASELARLLKGPGASEIKAEKIKEVIWPILVKDNWLLLPTKGPRFRLNPRIQQLVPPQ